MRRILKLEEPIHVINKRHSVFNTESVILKSQHTDFRNKQSYIPQKTYHVKYRKND